jgi:hypothetical protein
VTEQTADLDTSTPRWRRWTDLRSLRASLGSGLLGGACCIASAIATAAGLGAAGFFTTLMDRYQLYFIIGSVAIMALWLLRHLRRQGIWPLDFRAVIRAWTFDGRPHRCGVLVSGAEHPLRFVLAAATVSGPMVRGEEGSPKRVDCEIPASR